MRRTTLFLAFACVIVTACFPRHGRTAAPPPWSHHANVCFDAHIYQPSGTDRAALRAALDQVCSVFRNQDFQELVRREDGWTGDANGTCVGGTDVVERVLTAHYSNVHVLVNEVGYSATAETEVDQSLMPGRDPPVSGCRSTITVDPGWLHREWRSNDAGRAQILNTLAHEMTHAAPDGAACTYPFLDRTHTTCLERRLVSYHLGDMVECFLTRRGEFDDCLADRRPLGAAAEADCERESSSVCSADSGE